MQAIQDSPALALAVVLTRLKQKETEWKRAQREWNKIWRAVDAANYARSLDHQGNLIQDGGQEGAHYQDVRFADRGDHGNAVGSRRRARRPALRACSSTVTRTRTRWRTRTYSAMPSKLAFSYLSRLSGTQLRLDATRKNWVEIRLYSIVRAFFQLSEWDERPSMGRPRGSGKGPNSHPTGMVSVGAVTGTGTETVAGATSNGGGGGDDADATASSSASRSAAHGNARNGTLPANFSGDLRKSLLKSEQAKSTRGQTHPLPSPSPMGSRKPSPSPVPMALDDEAAVALSRSRSPAPAPALVPVSTTVVADLNLAGAEKRRSKRRSFFTNTWFYTLLRMIEVRRFIYNLKNYGS